MTCAQARHHLEQLVDGELPPALAAAVRSHLASCPACRAQHDEAASLPARLAALRAPAAPAGLLAAVMSRTAARPRAREVWGPIAAEALLVLIAGWYLSGVRGLLGLAERTAAEVSAALGWGAGQAAPAPAAGDLFLLLLSFLLVGTTLWHLTLLARPGPRRRT